MTTTPLLGIGAALGPDAATYHAQRRAVGRAYAVARRVAGGELTIGIADLIVRTYLDAMRDEEARAQQQRDDLEPAGAPAPAPHDTDSTPGA